jgi:hypothetical protein
MRKKTYNNVLRAGKLIQKKGYEKQEALEMALKVFDNHENDVQPIEFYIGMIIPKEEFKEMYNR